MSEKRRAQCQDEAELKFVDVKKAHLNAKCEEEEWVELPDELKKCGKYAKLKRWLYGTRKSGVRMGGRLRDKTGERRVRTGPASTIFYHPKSHVRVVVHGDDFPHAATESELRKILSNMCEWYDVMVCGVLGSGKRDVREEEILGRNLRWTEEGLEYEAKTDAVRRC